MVKTSSCLGECFFPFGDGRGCLSHFQKSGDYFLGRDYKDLLCRAEDFVDLLFEERLFLFIPSLPASLLALNSNFENWAFGLCFSFKIFRGCCATDYFKYMRFYLKGKLSWSWTNELVLCYVLFLHIHFSPKVLVVSWTFREVFNKCLINNKLPFWTQIFANIPR